MYTWSSGHKDHVVSLPLFEAADEYFFFPAQKKFSDEKLELWTKSTLAFLCLCCYASAATQTVVVGYRQNTTETEDRE
jgi:hypothetical protein